MTSAFGLRTFRNARDGALGVTNADDAIPAADELLGVGHQASLLESDSTLETVPVGADTPGVRTQPDSTPGSLRSVRAPEASDRHQPDCALCGLKARMWSGVPEWMDEDGRWIGWDSKECQRRWLDGWRPDPDHHGKLIPASVRRAATACEDGS